jgi:arylsulfatase A-like enzyme
MANMRSLYRAEVTQTDRWVGELMEQLRNRKLLENTAVLFLSDHGHYFGEHNMVGKFMKKGADRPSTIYEEVGHIPLLVRHPEGMAAGRRIGGLCQPQDLMPTLLDLAGLPAAPWTEGHSLVPRLRGDKAAQNFAVGGSHPHNGALTCLTAWTDEWCLVYSPITGLEQAELYHRPTDFGHTANVIESNCEAAKHLYDLMVSWFVKLGIPEARQRQMMHNADFGWTDKLRHKIWMFGNGLKYVTRYARY